MNHVLPKPDAVFLADVVAGLSKTPKTLPCKYFYDQRGSHLFEEICRLDEYYPTRTETRMLSEKAGEIGDLLPTGAHVVEFGSGSSLKIRLLLEALEKPKAYVPVDISGDFMRAEAEALAKDFDDLDVHPVHADFTKPFDLPVQVLEGPRVGFFPGSTIGNFTPEQARQLLLTKARTLGPGGGLLIGVDLKKDRDVLEAAYDDAKGVTAAFNLNLLARINRELDGNFDLDAFSHVALWNEAQSRVEMHLESDYAQTVRIDGQAFAFVRGETIHTENSYKYGVEDFLKLARTAGFLPRETWVDDDGLFSIHYLEVE